MFVDQLFPSHIASIRHVSTDLMRRHASRARGRTCEAKKGLQVGERMKSSCGVGNVTVR